MKRSVVCVRTTALCHDGELSAVLDSLMDTEWMVYTKDYLDHTGALVEYLARYAHRIAITNARILAIENQEVGLRYKDYRDEARDKTMRLTGQEFVRRFLLHVLPKGLMRIRHFGFLANRCRAEKLACIRRGLAAAEKTPVMGTEDTPEETPVYACPNC